MVKYLQDKKTGKLAGSIGDGKRKIPTITSLLTRHLPEPKTPQDYADLYNHLKPTARTGNPVDLALAFNPDTPKNLKEPSWFPELVKTSTTGAEFFETTPELLDIMSSPVGDIAVTWTPISQEINDTNSFDSGYDTNILHFRSMETGEILGYFKISSMTDESYARSFGTDEFAPFRYHSRYSGRSYRSALGFQGFNRYENEEGAVEPPKTAEELEELRRNIWVDASHATKTSHKKDDGTHISYYNIQPEDAPNADTINKDLKKFAQQIQKEIDQSRKHFNAEHPFVDFSRLTNANLQGKGYGTAMYIYVAQKLATQNKYLRASSLQSGSAQAVWDGFKKKMPEHLGEITLTWGKETSTYPTLDFRNKKP